MVLHWISPDIHLSKYLVIFGLSPKMDVILWIFHSNAKVRIYWSSQKCQYSVYLLQGAKVINFVAFKLEIRGGLDLDKFDNIMKPFKKV